MVTGDNLTTAEQLIRDQANAHQRDEELLIAEGRDQVYTELRQRGQLTFVQAPL